MTTVPTADEALMELALAEAATANHETSPNPMVGCVIAIDGTVIASAHHARAGEPHAEVNALRAAGDRADGADIYVTLEPCSRHGRTPPCVDALIAANPGRVIVAMIDPNPTEAGSGIARLRHAGIPVEVGLHEAEARRLNRFYCKHITTGLPFVTAKFAASLDGRIATASGESQWISSSEARQYAHSLRAAHDAVIVGVGTVIADDPELTNRSGAGREPLRVVLDSALRVTPEARVLAGPPGAALVITTDRARQDDIDRMRTRGVTVEVAETAGGSVDILAALRLLGGRDVISALIEGGARVLGSAFDARAVDQVVAILSPRIIGGRGAQAAVEGAGAAALSSAPLLRDITLERVGPDIVVTGYCGL